MNYEIKKKHKPLIKGAFFVIAGVALLLSKVLPTNFFSHVVVIGSGVALVLYGSLFLGMRDVIATYVQKALDKVE